MKRHSTKCEQCKRPMPEDAEFCVCEVPNLPKAIRDTGKTSRNPRKQRWDDE